MLGRNGLAVLSMNDGSVLAETMAPRTGRIFDYGDVVVSVNYPDMASSPVHVFDRNGTLLSSIGASRNRNALLIAPDGSAVYTLRNNVVTRYKTR
jgi:hypothetical protein